ncbi:15961_t:CDS:2 [Cetraspora pellucida]|uniref:15961_t:CDS:1 n=1 Tax=Cetraspora pellucida TaxID=1433469 RepID=A0A9N8Z7E4_9GLOM|nr:15961_t:CDS:2 [Cetraspora pellucida]
MKKGPEDDEKGEIAKITMCYLGLSQRSEKNSSTKPERMADIMPKLN